MVGLVPLVFFWFPVGFLLVSFWPRFVFVLVSLPFRCSFKRLVAPSHPVPELFSFSVFSGSFHLAR